MCGRHCRRFDLKPHSQFFPSLLPVMGGSCHSSGQQDGSLLGGISEKPLFLWQKRDFSVGTLFFAHFPFPNFFLQCDVWKCSSQLIAMKQQEWGEAHELWVMDQKAGMSVGPRWQAHIQILCCTRKIIPICLFLSNRDFCYL